jgi:hypothetical protein
VGAAGREALRLCFMAGVQRAPGGARDADPAAGNPSGERRDLENRVKDRLNKRATAHQRKPGP